MILKFLTRLFIHHTNFLEYTVYILEEDEYKQAAFYKSDNCAASQVFGGLKVHLEEVFTNK